MLSRGCHLCERLYPVQSEVVSTFLSGRRYLTLSHVPVLTDFTIYPSDFVVAGKMLIYTLQQRKIGIPPDSYY